MSTLPVELIERIAQAKTTCSFVVGSQGEVTSHDGSSKGLGNHADLELLKTLRANSEVVLTSGLTARVENYRMPRHADLAIFTKQGVSMLNLKPRAGQKLLILSPPVVKSYTGALRTIKSRYSSVQIEFGPKGARELRSEVDLFVISSKFDSAPEVFCDQLELTPIAHYSAMELFITLATGRA